MHSLFDLTGRVALVTGGSKGLGKATARLFAEAGADVIIASRSEADLREAAAEISAGLTATVTWVSVDLADRTDVTLMLNRLAADEARVDILINNAGASRPQAVDEISDDAWDGIVELNLTSCMALTRALAPQMKQRGWGRVINISSIFALASKEKRAAYSATKSALVGYTRAAALDLGPFGITVNCIAPGCIYTSMSGTVLTPEQQQALVDRTALGRWGDPREMAGPALMLASDAGAFVTGSVLVVDGGALVRTF